MEKLLRILAIIGALPLAFIGLQWIFDPSGAAAGLQMSLLEGAARNSQIGDTTSFFIGMSGFALYGIMKEKAAFLYAATFLLGGVAVFRVLGGLVHDAPTIWMFVAIEVVTSAIWIAHARNMNS
jgi:hypothetical protein